MVNERNLKKFLIEISHLNPIEFLGIAKIFNIDLEKNDDFEKVLSEVIDKYISLSRRQRRNLLKIIKLSNLEKINPTETFLEENIND